MNLSSEQPAVICFGEVLWDVSPSTATPGGAPMNVAYHLQQLGINATLVSRVGADEKGQQLLQHLQNWGLSTAFCQTDQEHKTSEVLVRLDEHKDVTYDILYPVAWDFVSFEEAHVPLVQQADALVFGSLITRHDVSQQTLLRLLELSSYNVFDVNLREPYYTPAKLAQLLPHTNLLKLNVEELELVTGYFNQSLSTEQERIALLQNQFNIHEIILTKGSKGASYYTPNENFHQEAFAIEVADTIGSGDSFLAAFLAKKLRQQPPEAALAFAATLAAFVTMHHGACPPYELQTLHAFQQQLEQQG
ncbi:carbohydrate kinase family protein [Pontibacter sp. 13R65]|uniref:carbohydrate kinase family protein n=1 Tax=Pontibacter sp. 13R65 TaxID=3127458 RepID=UPI00301D162C